MKNKRRILYAAIALMLVAFVYNLPLQVSTYRHKRDLEKIFNDYSRAIESGDFSSAYAFGDSAFKGTLDLKSYAAQQSGFESRFGAVKSIREGGVYMHGRGSPMRWTAIVEEIRQYEKADVRFLCEFHLENGRWQLFGCKQST